jgi:hypothetical protein
MKSIGERLLEGASKYNVLMNIMSQFLDSCMLIPALLHIRNNKWEMR